MGAVALLWAFLIGASIIHPPSGSQNAIEKPSRHLSQEEENGIANIVLLEMGGFVVFGAIRFYFISKQISKGE